MYWQIRSKDTVRYSTGRGYPFRFTLGGEPMPGKNTGLEPGFYGYLDSRGISRRSFVKFCGGIAAALGWSYTMTPKIAKAIEDAAEESQGSLAPVIWLEAGSCSGCTESAAQAANPDIATIVLDLISLNYAETLSAGAGYSLEEAKSETIEAGGYILVYEGAVMTGWDGNALRIADHKGTDILLEAAENADAIIACGSCAVDGGWAAAYPNPGDATGVQNFLEENGVSKPIINIPCCPVNPEALVAVLVDYLLIGQLPELNSKNMPESMFGQAIHDNCPRRGHFENGEFVYKFGSEEEKKGYCLYPVGCRGPQTSSNCPRIKWNRNLSWCVQSGAPCCGCAQADPSSNSGNWVEVNAPFISSRHRDIRIGDFAVQPQTIALTVAGVVAAAVVVHGFGMKASKRTGGGAPIETVTDYERKQRLKREATMSAYGITDTEENDGKGGGL